MQGSIPTSVIVLLVVVAVLLFSMFLVVLARYRRCPSDKVMVIYGKVGTNKDGTARSAKCIHGGAAFIWPIIQSYEYLDLTPISINVDLANALSHQNIRVDVPSRFTVGISVEPGIMQNAAERLLGLKLSEIQELAKDIIFGQLRLVIATMDIEEINTDRDKFLEAVSPQRGDRAERKSACGSSTSTSPTSPTSRVTSRPWVKRPPPRPSTTPRRRWPRRTGTVRWARPRPSRTSASA